MKCDATKPVCKRCESRGYICPGYRDFRGIVFKDVSRSVFERQSRRAKNSSAFITPRIPVELKLDAQTACVHFFFRNWVLAPHRDTLTSHGHFDHLMPLYSTAAPSSPLALATTIMAARAMCLYYNQDQNTSWLARSDVIACRALRKAITDVIESVRDETLLAVLCLDVAERLSSRTVVKPPSRAHLDGAIALVQHRGPEGFNNNASRSLLAATRSNAILQTPFYDSKESSLNAVASLPDVDPGDCNPAIALNHILTRVLKLKRLMVMSTQGIASEELHQHILSQASLARQLDSQLLDWYNRTPLEWKLVVYQPQLVGPRPIQRMAGGLPSLRVAYIVGQWYCTRLMVRKFLYAATIKDCNDVQHKTTELRRFRANAQMDLDGLCSVLSFIKSDRGPVDTSKAMIERMMERCAMVTDERSAYGSSTPAGRWPVLNLLSWALATLTERLRGVQESTFSIHPDTLKYLHDEYRVAFAVFKEQTQYDSSSP